MIRHWWLYAIALHGGKYYVGITSYGDPYRRLRQHGTLLGARWTKKYRPIKPIKPVVLKDIWRMSLANAEKREQQLFEEFRSQYGIKNVRGGRIVGSGNIYRIGKVYFDRNMLETLGVALLLLTCGLYLIVAH